MLSDEIGYHVRDSFHTKQPPDNIYDCMQDLVMLRSDVLCVQCSHRTRLCILNDIHLFTQCLFCEYVVYLITDR